MARGYKRKRTARRTRRYGRKRGSPKTTARPKRYTRKYRGGIPRTIQPASYTRGTLAVSFDYQNSFVVDGRFQQQLNGASYANGLQICTINVNNLKSIFDDHRPFAIAKVDAGGTAVAYPPVHVAPQSPVPTATTQCPGFERFGVIYEEFAVVGAKVEWVFRPKDQPYVETITGTQTVPSHTIAAGTVPAMTIQETGTGLHALQQDATRLIYYQTDAKSMDSTNMPESIFPGTTMGTLKSRPGMTTGRFAMNNGMSSSKYVCQKWSSKKFFQYSDLKDNNEVWCTTNVDGTPNAPDLEKMARMVIALQKEEINSPAQSAQRYQNPYFAEMKIQWTVLFRNPRKSLNANLPTAGAAAGHQDVVMNG